MLSYPHLALYIHYFCLLTLVVCTYTEQEYISIPVTDLLTPRQEAVPGVSVPAPSFSHQVGSELASVPVMPLTSVLPLPVEESPLPSTVLANGGKIPFSMPEAFLDDGDMVLGDEIDDLLDSAPETNETAMVKFSITSLEGKLNLKNSNITC